MKCCLLLPSFVSCIKVYKCEMVPFLAFFLEERGLRLFTSKFLAVVILRLTVLESNVKAIIRMFVILKLRT